tara:strand:+ start:707 stop:1378 length:672 start_codon:yes stop_codon:yes gene_type:complete
MVTSTLRPGDDIALSTLKQSDKAKLLAKQTADASKKLAKKSAASAKRAAKKSAEAAKRAAKKAAKAASDNAGKLIAGGLAIGGALYLEDQFKDAEEDIKDCMKVCLPENWDDFNYGDLKKSELNYRVLEGEDADPNQPLCTETIEDCGEYCGDKCEDLHEYEIPGSKTLKGAGKGAKEAAKGVFDVFKDILGLDGDGFLGKWVSGFCIFILLLIVFSVMMKMK